MSVLLGKNSLRGQQRSKGERSWESQGRGMHRLASSLISLPRMRPSQPSSTLSSNHRRRFLRPGIQHWAELGPASPPTAQQNTGPGLHDLLLSELVHLARAPEQQSLRFSPISQRALQQQSLSRSMCAQTLCQILVGRGQTDFFC